MISRTQKSRSLAIAIASGALFLSVFGVGCSFTVDSDVLIAGDEGIECASDEKKCPIDREDKDGPKECVANTLQQYGCARSSCDPCALPGATSRCSTQGECVISTCNVDRLDCDNDVANGCEVEFEIDELNCGKCGNTQTRANICEPPNATPLCVSGTCTIGICIPPFDDCDGSIGNGCETNLDTDAEHCGSCSTDEEDFSCEVGQTCVDGVCM